MLPIIEMLETIDQPKLRSKFCLLYEEVEDELKSKPASVQHHHNEIGGLYRHTNEVMDIATTLFTAHNEYYNTTWNNVVIASFIHDFHKIGCYRKTEDAYKLRKGQKFEWDKSVVDMEISAKAVWICSQYGIVLDAEVVNAVTFHHGAWAPHASSVFQTRGVQEMSHLALLLHHADCISTKVYG